MEKCDLLILEKEGGKSLKPKFTLHLSEHADEKKFSKWLLSWDQREREALSFICTSPIKLFQILDSLCLYFPVSVFVSFVLFLFLF